MTGLDLLRESGALIAGLEAPEGMDADELDARLAAWLDGQCDKLGAYYSVVRRLEVEDDLHKTIADRVAAHRRFLARQKEHLRKLATLLLLDQEVLTGEAKVKRPEFSAWLQETDSVELRVVPAKLAKAYRRVVVEADKTAIKAAIKAGKKVRGCSVVASRSVRWR